MDFDYKLLIKYMVETLSPDEWAKVSAWCEASEENAAFFAELRRLRFSRDVTFYADEGRLQDAWNRTRKRIHRPRRSDRWKVYLKYAAIVLLCLVGGYGGWWWYCCHRCAHHDVEIALAQGESVKKITLVDGSVVWLKGNSTLTIPRSFNPSHRCLSLKGEAFFDVKKNPRSPFTVSTGFINVEARGTSFSVRTDHCRQLVETILLDGWVELCDPKGEKVIDMAPGEKVTYSYLRNRYVTQTVDATVSTAWRFNQFVFENATFREIAKQLSAKYGVNINIESSKLAQHTFRCVINEDETLTEVLNQLCYVAPIHYNIEDDEVYIYAKTDKP